MITLRKSLLAAALSLATISSHQLFGMQQTTRSSRQIERISNYIEKNKSEPHNIVLLIQHLCNTHGYAQSVSLLKAANLHKSIRNTIKNLNGTTCLQDACCMETCSLDVIKTIIELADVYGAWNMIALHENNGLSTSAWHLAVEAEREDIVNEFMHWALANSKKWKSKNKVIRSKVPKDNLHKGIQTLLAFQNNNGETGLHLAAAKDNVVIFKNILEQADSYKYGLAWELLLMNDNQNRNLVDNTDTICGESTDAILDIIEEYRIKYLLAGMDYLKLNDDDSDSGD